MHFTATIRQKNRSVLKCFRLKILLPAFKRLFDKIIILGLCQWTHQMKLNFVTIKTKREMKLHRATAFIILDTALITVWTELLYSKMLIWVFRHSIKKITMLGETGIKMLLNMSNTKEWNHRGPKEPEGCHHQKIKGNW